MKKTFLHLCFTILLILCSSGGFAQIIVDGDLTEWGDPKKMNYDQENKLYYSFKKDKQFLYMAIFKNQNVQKYKANGIQLFFSDKKADTTCLGITFANSYKDSITKEYLRGSHDTFTVQNLGINKKHVLPTYNETGIMVEWRATDIDHIPRGSNIIDPKRVPADPNIFVGEIQIPLSLLKKLDANILHFSISLRSYLYGRKGNHTMLLSTLSNPQTIFDIERLDNYTTTQYIGVVDLSKL